MRLPSAFAEFHERIQLGEIPEGKIRSAWSRLQAYLIAELTIPQLDVFVQGSYANDTAVKPASPQREYDLDTVAIGFDSDPSENAALERLEGVLAKNTDYKKRIERRAPCVRLRYAADSEGRFHVDVVPARHGSTAPIQVPRRNEGWHDSDPRGYTNWCRTQGAQFSRTVRMLKRWRDFQQSDRRKVKSIVLQVLVGQFYAGGGNDEDAVVAVFTGIESLLDGLPGSVPSVPNPILPTEDLTARWLLADYRDFRKEVGQAAAIAKQAIASSSTTESHELWRQLFGPDFPPTPPSSSDLPPTPRPGYERYPQSAPRQEERYA